MSTPKKKVKKPVDIDKGNSSQPSSMGKRWYREEDANGAAVELWNTVQRIRQSQQWKQCSDDLAMCLYSDQKMVGFQGEGTTSYSNIGLYSEVLNARQADNMIFSIINTIHSKVIKLNPIAKVLTDNANWSQLNKAKNLEKWGAGKLYQCNAYSDIFPETILHALILGTGAVKCCSNEDDGAYLELVPPWEILVDDADGRSGKPRCMYHVKAVDRNVLSEMFPDKREFIESAPALTTMSEWTFGFGAWETGNESNLVIVAEGWHLPSGPNAKDGCHLMTIGGEPLFEPEEWTRKDFPLRFIKGRRRGMGFWGVGFVELLMGAQYELTKTTLTMIDMLDLLSVPYIAVPREANVEKGQLNNIPGHALEYSGPIAPRMIAENAIPQELWKHRDTIKRNMFEVAGVSQLSAASLKPAGLNSGKALRVYNDIESDLLIDIIRNYENLVLECTKMLFNEQKSCGDKFKPQSVSYLNASGRGIEKIQWSKADMEEDQYTMRIVPASALSNSISGRIEDLMDLRNLGAISNPEEIRELLNMPDLNRQGNRAMAHRLLLERVIEYFIIEEGEYIDPESNWDLALAKELALTNQQKLQYMDDAPEDRLDLLDMFVIACDELMSPPPQPPVPPQLNAAPGAPPGPAINSPPINDIDLSAGGTGAPLVKVPKPGKIPPTPQGLG